MNNSAEHIYIDLIPGTRIRSACNDAVRIANFANCTVSFYFNTVQISVTKDTNPDDAVAMYYSEF